jgi:alkylation response protein AidB-like acyl-CoA dehydrogenase
LSGRDEELRHAARAFAAEVLTPGAPGWEERAELPLQVIRDGCRLGLGATVVPAEHGGAGLSYRGAVAVFEELAYGDFTTAFALLVQNSVSRSVLSFGTDAQRERALPGLASGELVGAWAITEQEAGSDVGAMQTTARAEDGDWMLDGGKWLISNAAVADLLLVAAKTDEEAGSRGISVFLLERGTPGLQTPSRRQLLGARGLAVGEVELRSCRVAADALLGPLHGGFKIALDSINFARVVWGGLAAGLARAALDQAIRGLEARVQFGRPLTGFQAIQFQLADLAVEIEATRALAYHTAALFDAGPPAIVEAAMTKRRAADVVVRVCSEALELAGGLGYVVPSTLERYLRQARLAQLADGTTNIQRASIAGALIRKRE